MAKCVLLALITSLVVSCSSLEFEPTDEHESLRSIIRIDQSLLIGSSSALYRIDSSSLNIQERLSLEAESRLLITDVGGTYDGNVFSCDNRNCFLAEIGNLSNTSWNASSSIVIENGLDNVIASFVPASNGTSQLIFGETANGESARRFTKGGLLNVNLSGPPRMSQFSEIAARLEMNRFEYFNYYAQFSHNEFVYFVTSPVETETFPRIVRFCQNDTGTRDSDAFGSDIEIKLGCGQRGVITAATFVNFPPFTEPTVLISTLIEMTMHVCTYTLSEIDFMMWNKFQTCLDGKGLTGYNRNGLDMNNRRCRPISEENQVNARICSLPANLRQGLEVEEALEKSPLFSYNLHNTEHFTSLTTTVVQGSFFLFAGSSRSNLYQFFISSPLTSMFIRSQNLNEPPMTNVTHLLTSADGEFIYAMTPNKVYRHTVDQCRSYVNCTSCVTANDPICGWCALSGVCVRNSSCNSVRDSLGVDQKIYIQNEQSCPRIESVTPSTVHLEVIKETSIDIALRTSNILNTSAVNFNYQCVYFFPLYDTTCLTDTNKDITTNTFTCATPPRIDIPPLPDSNDTINAFVSLQPMATSTIFATLETPIGFTNCSIHTSCSRCLGNGEGKCKWCPLSFACISNREESRCPRSLHETTFNETCGVSILPHPNTTNYFIHSGYQYSTHPLQVLSEGLRIFNNGIFQCRICQDEACSNIIETTSATLLPSDVVRCNLNSLTYNLSVLSPSVNLTLQVLVNNSVIDNPSNAQVVVYRCDLLGTNCAQCLSLYENFGCRYCGVSFGEPGNCHFNNPSTCPSGQMDFLMISDCDAPFITDFNPKSGPTPGGTEIAISGHNLGVQMADIIGISIGGVACTITAYTPGIGVNCTTGSMQSNLVNDKIVIQLSFEPQTITISSNESFRYLAPSLNNRPAMPSQGPTSGGTRINVTGVDLGIGSQHQVLIRQQSCEVQAISQNSIVCITPASSNPVINNLIEVRIDNWSAQISGYDYLPDPTFQSITPNLSFVSGGTNYTVMGEELDIVQEPRLLMYVMRSVSNKKRQADTTEEVLRSEPCVTISSMEMHCKAPSFTKVNTAQNNDGRSMITVRMGLLMDRVESLLDLNTSLTIYPDPEINDFRSVLEFRQRDRIVLTISGERFLFTPNQVVITIMPCMSLPTPCTCSVSRVHSSNNTLVCEVTDPEDLATNQALTVTVTIGSFSDSPGQIQINTTPELLIILIPAFAGFIIACVAFFIVLFAVFYRKTRQKDQRYDQLMMELERLESSVARECKLGFAELQTDLDELTGDVAGCRLPYHDMQTFLLASLFQRNKDHPVMHHIEVPSHQRPLLEKSLRDFGDLLNDRKILLLFIQTLEEQRSFTIRDKSYVGSLLIVALHNRMDYATDVLKKLLTQLIRKTITNSNSKLLLRRTESIAEKMLTNWLAFCLHSYILEHVGQPMYMLYRAVKNQLEKGPVDVITGEARYSLSEQKLIRQKVDVITINATVDAEDGLRVPVKLLDCDTISQTKEKLLDSMFRAAPVSRRPRLTDVDLEYLKSPSETMLLRDEDHSTIIEGGWKRINTLRHYWVQDGAMFRIKTRRDYPPPGRAYDYPGSIISSHSPRTRALSEAEDGSRVWHLFKQVDVEDPKRSPFLNNKKMVSEIYLPRMLSTKSILQNFVDDLFKALFSVSHPPSSPSTLYTGALPQSPSLQVPIGYAPGADAVPMAIKYLFDFLDDEAENHKIVDQDVVHTWKNNALSLRFWVNMIKNPEFVFDINKSHTVDACLSVIAQAFIDGCSTVDAKLNIDSPTSKLLYNKEVQGYKAKVKRYYTEVKQMPRIPEDAMQYYLRQLSEYQGQQMKKTGGFVTESAVHELLRYASRYSEPFLMNLKNAGLQHRAYQFESIINYDRPATEL